HLAPGHRVERADIVSGLELVNFARACQHKPEYLNLLFSGFLFHRESPVGFSSSITLRRLPYIAVRCLPRDRRRISTLRLASPTHLTHPPDMCISFCSPPSPYAADRLSAIASAIQILWLAAWRTPGRMVRQR